MCGGGLARGRGILPAEDVFLLAVLKVDEAGLGPFAGDVEQSAAGGALGKAELVPGGLALGSIKEAGVT
jgi:hypothetical protein